MSMGSIPQQRQRPEPCTVDEMKQRLIEDSELYQEGEAARIRRIPNIIRAINDFGLTQTEVAKLCTMDQAAVSRLFRRPGANHRRGRRRKTTTTTPTPVDTT